ncbi:MAG: glycosyltransferase family 2 protein [Pseudomonadota bacterium]
MRISVLTVTYNSAKTLPYTLDSFFAQSHADKELVIVDGASTDNTMEIVERYAAQADNVKFISEPDRSMYDALNKGLKLYTGDAMGVLNSDDRYAHNDVLAKVAEGLTKAPSIHGHLDFVNNHDSRRIVRRWRGRAMPKRGFRYGWMPAHPTFYVRREIAERTGLFDTSYQIAADYDWMIRAINAQGRGPELIEDIMIHMQSGGMSTNGIAAYLKHNWEASKIRRKNNVSGFMDFALFTKPARKVGQWLPVVSLF